MSAFYNYFLSWINKKNSSSRRYPRRIFQLKKKSCKVTILFLYKIIRFMHEIRNILSDISYVDFRIYKTDAIAEIRKYTKIIIINSVFVSNA